MIQKQNVKIGLMGLGELDWLSTLSQVDIEDLEYEDFVEAAKRLCQFFKSEKVDLIIALTHMRVPNDDLLAEKVPEIDLILGGHDHMYYLRQTPNNLIVKSGADFKCFSHLKLKLLSPDSPFEESKELTKDEKLVDDDIKDHVDYCFVVKGRIVCEMKRVNVAPDTKPDEKMVAHVKKYYASYEEKMKEVLCYFKEDIDCTFGSVRGGECAIGNLIADFMRVYFSAEVAVVQGGGLRAVDQNQLFLHFFRLG